ncbi:MAG TPA: proton-conducting transporter membrane subunit [Pseudolabrys sp.]|jgi:multicomponent Na+:H+ antiporter subunit D|nr:proton-conducting transporter membrane subunit [Pseudolabrys sp.]
MPLAPLPVVVPLLAAVLLLVVERHVPLWFADLTAMLVALATAGIAAVLTYNASQEPILYWFGGWQPTHGAAIGISFVIDPAGAAVACFAALLFAGAFLFGWHYFDDARARYHILMLVFLAAMTGFCLTGDLFNLFVFFELMSVTAFAVTAYKLEASEIEGALNFTVMNTIGSFLILAGIALLYGRTGALNLAQIGRAIGASEGSALPAMAFVLLFTGLMIKAAVMPFHFWLADAHAVAPTPVCVIFSGIMVSVALFGAGRIYWTIFAPIHSTTAVFKSFLLHVGVATAVLGGCTCLMQRHIKRLLAFSTISHIGVMLAGLAVLTPGGTAGFLLYLAGHGLTKGALFMLAGILMSAHQDIDEIALRGKARDLPISGICFVLGGLLLAGLPFGLIDTGRGLIDKATEGVHAWIPYLLALGSALTGAAVLRTAGRVFLGLGPDPGEEEKSPTNSEHEKQRPSGLMLVPVIVFLVACLAAQPHVIEDFALKASAMFMNHDGYAALVLDGSVPQMATPPAAHSGPLIGWLAVAVAILVAGFQLAGDRLPRSIRRVADLAAFPFFKSLDLAHTGHIGDYAAWMTFGLVLFALAFVW